MQPYDGYSSGSNDGYSYGSNDGSMYTTAPLNNINDYLRLVLPEDKDWKIAIPNKSYTKKKNMVFKYLELNRRKKFIISMDFNTFIKYELLGDNQLYQLITNNPKKFIS